MKNDSHIYVLSHTQLSKALHYQIGSLVGKLRQSELDCGCLRSQLQQAAAQSKQLKDVREKTLLLQQQVEDMRDEVCVGLAERDGR